LNYKPNRKEFNNYKPISYTYEELNENNKEYIKTLKEYEFIKINNYKILLIHGDGYFKYGMNIEETFNKFISSFDFDICIFGHTHEFLYREYKDKIFINPGSLGQPVDSSTYKYCILEINDDIFLELKEIDILESYGELEEAYKNKNYYKLNRVWGDITLKSIKMVRIILIHLLS